MHAFARMAALVGLVAWPDAAMAVEETVTGMARVIDGDTIEIDGAPIHLHGIDAPELEQLCAYAGRPTPCGRDSAARLRRIIGTQTVTCRTTGRDGQGDLMAKCKAGWRDLGAEMVTTGMAVAALELSQDYLQNHREARGQGIGIFAGTFVMPDQWRAGKRLAIENAGAGSAPP